MAYYIANEVTLAVLISRTTAILPRHSQLIAFSLIPKVNAIFLPQHVISQLTSKLGLPLWQRVTSVNSAV